MTNAAIQSQSAGKYSENNYLPITYVLKVKIGSLNFPEFWNSAPFNFKYEIL